MPMSDGHLAWSGATEDDEASLSKSMAWIARVTAWIIAQDARGDETSPGLSRGSGQRVGSAVLVGRSGRRRGPGPVLVFEASAAADALVAGLDQLLERNHLQLCDAFDQHLLQHRRHGVDIAMRAAVRLGDDDVDQTQFV